MSVRCIGKEHLPTPNGSLTLALTLALTLIKWQVAERLLGGYIAMLIGDIATGSRQLHLAAEAVEAGREKWVGDGNDTPAAMRIRCACLLEAETASYIMTIAARAHLMMGGVPVAKELSEKASSLVQEEWGRRLTQEIQGRILACEASNFESSHVA